MINHRLSILRTRSLSRLVGVLTSLACVLLSAFCLLPTAFGQSATATLSGTVEDPNGAMVAGAKVKVVNLNTGLERDTTTNDSGVFTIVLLPPSTYTVRVERDGFVTIEVSDVVLNVNDERSLRIQMKVGDVKEVVNVTDEASLIDESPAVGTVVDRQFVENIPLNGRSFQSLIALTPGVVLTRSTINEQGQFSVNGQRADANYFSIDGVSANIGVSVGFNPGQASGGSTPGLSVSGGSNNLVSVDALQEFKVLTSTFAPEYGRTPGGQISIVTRSGTKDFHGTIFEYFRNDAMDANDWFGNSSSLPKPPLRHNQFGGVLGGPIVKSSTFFFFSYEGLRLRQPSISLTEVPTLASRQAAPLAIQPLLKAFPQPNGPATTNGFARFSASFANPATLDATSIRIDHYLNSAVSLFGRYSKSPSHTEQRGGAFALSVLRSTEINTETLTAGATFTITPAASNELRFNYSRNKGIQFDEVDSFGGAAPVTDSFFAPASFALQEAQFSLDLGRATANVQAGKNVTNVQRQINVVDSLYLTTGAHQLKFGIDYRRLSPYYDVRKYDVNLFFDGVAGPTGSPDPGTALSGTLLAFYVSGNEPNTFFYNNFSAYGQDNWKVSSRLTLTYGLRWEVNPPPSGDRPLLTVAGLDNPATLTVAPEGTPLYKTTYNNFAPRVGAAYQLSRGTGRETILRGGVGIFYDLGTGVLGSAVNNYPYVRSKPFTFFVPYPLTVAAATPLPFSPQPPFPVPIIVTVADPELKLPRTYQWNFAIEQSLGANQTISASYVGAAGRSLLRQERLTPPLVSSTFSQVRVTRNAATSNYHALQVQFQRRLTAGLQALASYTFGRSHDTASVDSFEFPPSGKLDPELDRGPSDFDVRHSFNGAISYNIPKRFPGALGALLNDWSLDGILTARSALPINVTYNRTITGIGGFAFRPDLVPDVPIWIDDPTAPGAKRLNSAVNPANARQRGAFVAPAASEPRQGNLGRNSLRGFPLSQLDVALRRQFSLGERLKLQFRAEFFNLLNHPNFANPVTTMGSFSTNAANPQGRITGTSAFFGRSQSMLGRSLGSGGVGGGLTPLYQVGGPRSIQFAVKLKF